MADMTQLLSYFLHIDQHLAQLIAWAGGWSYVVLFGVIFCETGLVVMPFLPGDSFLFAAGSLAALGALNLPLLIGTLFAAAFLGNEVNYWVGRKIGLKLLEGPFKRFIDKRHIVKAEAFFAKHGVMAVVFARFIPIVRTIVPFTAGISRMDPKQFTFYNAVGAALWIVLFTLGGYMFGNLPSVKENFSLVVLAIIFLSILPPVIEWWRERKIDSTNIH